MQLRAEHTHTKISERAGENRKQNIRNLLKTTTISMVGKKEAFLWVFAQALNILKR